MLPDLLIVGGGVIGLGIASEALRRGLTVTLLERERLGARASWAGAGMLNGRPWPRVQTPDYHDLILASLDRYPAWTEHLREETDQDPGYRRCGGIEFYTATRATPAGLDNLERMYAGCRARGVPVEKAGPAEIRALEPALAAEQCVAGLHFPRDAQVRTPRLVRALALACRQRGATLCEGVEAAAAWIEKGVARGVLARDGTRYEAGQTIFCTGAWTGQFPELVQACPRLRKIEPVRGQIACFQTAPGWLSRLVTAEHHYLLPRPDGLLLVGSTTERVGFEEATTPEKQAELAEFACTLLPALRSAPGLPGWAGLRPGLKGPHPLLGPVPGIARLFVAAGHFRNGIVLAPITAELLVALLCGDPPAVPLEPWRPQAQETKGRRARQAQDEEEE